MSHNDVIERRGNRYLVLSESGKHLGDFGSEEEARERLRQIEAAKAARGDAAPVVVRRFDRLGPIRFLEDPTDRTDEDQITAHIDPTTGFLRVDARLTRTGVFQYADSEGASWGELRTEDEVFNADSMRSFEMAVVTDDHPDEFVSARNVRDVQRGHSGSDVRRDGDFLRSSIMVTDADAIQKVKDGKTELSNGYTAVVVMDAGVAPDGTPFAGRQTQIRGNHIAIVDRGRAGPECRLLVNRGDAYQTTGAEAPQHEDTDDDMTKIKIGDHEIEVSQEVADALEQERAAKNEDTRGGAPPFRAGSPDDDEEEDESKDSADFTTLRAKNDALEAELAKLREDQPQRIDERVELVATAREVLGSDVQTRGVSDSVLKRAIVLKVNPKLEGKLDANKTSPGYLDASYEHAVSLHNDRKSNESELNSVVFDAMHGDAQDDLDSIRADFLNKRSNAWKGGN